MNIGIIVDNEFNDDIRVLKEVEILKEAGYGIFVLCYGFNRKKYAEIEGIQIERIEIKQKIKDTLFFFFNRIPIYEFLWERRIYKFIEKYSIDILHAHDLYLSKAAFRGSGLSKRDCPVILDLHENYPAVIQDYNWTRGFIRHLLSAPQKWKKKEGNYLNYASKIVVLSNHYKESLLQKYSFLNSLDIVAFPNVIDFKRFKNFKTSPIAKRNKNVTLFYFGAIAERRGIFFAIEALRNVLKNGTEVHLLIIGPVDKADKEKFFTVINQQDVKSYIKYIPWIPLSELVSFLINNVDICLAPFVKNPQHESGVANKIYQYMFGGKPIIASDCLPQKELIKSADCGLVYADRDEFEAHIISLTRQPELRKKMGENGRNALFKRYNNQEFSNVLVDLYKSVKTSTAKKDNMKVFSSHNKKHLNG